MAYSMDQDPDIGDASTGRIFAGKFKRHADLNELLASTKDRDKLEAMRRIIESVSSGKDVSQLFASVVKNVVSKNPEIKKLVYVYLVRYAEEQQDLALLSISTFQKALKDPNQLIRASALRVLSSIRVSIIVPIMMLAIKEAVTDMSPFVRKTACHAIPKLYNLDPELKEPLVEVIERLLKDKTTLVSGSAVMAFEELCPDRIDLIHKNYRKLCNLLVDIDEWGQTAVIHMLTRYARSQFVDPNKEEPENEQFYPSSQESEDDEEDNNDKSDKKKPYIMDPDHRLILRVTKPLLQSRNSAVVMAVARLYHHCAPACEVGVVTRALVRLLKGHREVQYVVLSNIATLSSTRKGMFEAHLKSFFVHSNDSKYIKTFKLEIMTNIASESNITLLLREFQNYINNSDKEFVASTIQAIGRCASNIPEVTDTCLTGLVRLLSNRNETVVAESVVMIKKLLQLKHKDKSQIIIQMTKILNKITVPMARASIIWLVGEYAERVPKVAPDVLRIAAKSFTKEEDIVKLQIINLGAKLILINPNQTQQLCQYVLNLAKYDQSYDIRDRARFLRPIVFPGEKVGQIVKHSKKILLASKPPPVLESSFKGHGEFIVGSLSHLINARASGYQELPEYPEVPPDPSVRNVEVEPLWEKSKSKSRSKKKSTFYSSESESDSASESESGSGSSGSSGSESESDEGSESVSKSSMESLPGSETESQESDDEGERNERAKSRKKSESQSSIESKTSEESSDSDAESSESDSSQESDNAKQETPAKKVETKKSDDAPKNKRVSKPPTTDQLLSFDEDIPVAPVVNGPAHKNILSPSLVDDMKTLSLGVVQNGVTAVVQNVVTDFSQLRTYELLNKMAGRGLQAQYKFPRSPCLYSTTMVAVEVTFTNSGSSCVENIHVGEKKVGLGLKIADFPKIESIDIGSTVTVSMGIDFKDTIQPVSFEICTNSDKFTVKLKCPMGEQLHARPITENDFLSLQKKLSGMNESSLTVDIPQENCEERVLASKILGCASVAALPKNSSLNYYRFSGSAISSGVPVLITVELKDFGKASRITVNCEKMTINSILAKELVAAVGKV